MSAATPTERVRRHRDRQARGVVVIDGLEITEAVATRLIADGWLSVPSLTGEIRVTRAMVAAALSRMLDAWAGA